MLTPTFRSLIRQPSFGLAAAGTLALGIAAPTALFSTVNTALLTPLPYPRSQDIYTVRTYFPSGRFTIGLVASEELETLQRFSDAVASTAAARRTDAIVTDGTPRPIVAYGVSGRFFDLFGVPMARGRGVAPSDDVRGAAPVVVLSHAFWTTAHGARTDVVGKTITINERPVRVIGVARAGFDVPSGADAWFNLHLPPDNIGHYFDGYVRLRPGVTVASLQQRMRHAMKVLGRKYPDQEQGRAFRLTPLLDATVGDLQPILLILFAATGLLLVHAAVNVVNLTLARSTGRTREMAVRAALGASRRRIIAHVVAESLLLSVVGGLAGLAGAYAGMQVLMRAGGSRLPRLDALTFDGTVLAFAAALMVATGLIVGLVPALRLATSDVAWLMNEGGRGMHGSHRTRRLLRSFVVAEIAVAVALVAAAARLVMSYERLARVDPGFDPRGRLVLDVLLPPSYATRERLAAWWEPVEARLRGAGATRVAAASSLPLEHEWDITTFVDIVSKPGIPPAERPNGRLRRVTPGFFSAMGIRLLKGRDFSTQDRPDSPPVTVVNEAFVRRSLSDVDPLRERVKGFSFRIVDGRPVAREVAIVGVVADVRYAGLAAIPEPIVYVPASQSASLRQSIVITTSGGHPEHQAAAFKAVVQSVDPTVTVDAHSLSASVAASLERPRLGMWLMTGFGLAALALAMVGVFGVIAYASAQRTGEMAIRQALGATRLGVFWTIVGEGGGAAAIGIGAGTIIAWWTGVLIGRYVYEVRAGDPAVLVGSALAVAVVAISATLFPAVRAAGREPARALRQE